MNSISSPHIVPESRPVPGPILHILEVVHGVTTQHDCLYVVVGATARDLLLFHVFGIPASRATMDVDFAIAVASWDRFHRMRNALLATEKFVASNVEQRLYSKEIDIPIDLIPFGGVAEDDAIAWPPDRGTVMTVAGFEDALAASVQVQVSLTLAIPVVSLAALAILKIFAWQDRNTMDKDAVDLYRVISTYAEADNEDRLYDLDSPHMEKFDYDPEFAGAALAGEDGRMISSAGTVTKLRRLVTSEGFVDNLAERIRASRWQFQPEKLPYVRAVLVAYFDELLK